MRRTSGVERHDPQAIALRRRVRRHVDQGAFSTGSRIALTPRGASKSTAEHKDEKTQLRPDLPHPARSPSVKQVSAPGAGEGIGEGTGPYG